MVEGEVVAGTMREGAEMAEGGEEVRDVAVGAEDLTQRPSRAIFSHQLSHHLW